MFDLSKISDLSKIFELSKIFGLPNILFKSKNYCNYYYMIR